MKMAFKIIVRVILFLIFAFIGFVAYISILDYRPDVIEDIEVSGPKASPYKLTHDTFSLLSWNIGYAGLGAEMDFFYDDGVQVRPTKKMGRKYLDNIKTFIGNQDSVDFFVLQEIDVRARRSHNFNEVDEINRLLQHNHSAFAKNYHCQFVPVPLYEPLGYVKGGMLTFSEFPITEAKRYAYPLIASWPNKLFLLDRCFILTRFPLENGKDLVVLNTHNSAYVTDSILRIKELNIMKEKMLEEYSKGNYVVAGGDWNANPPNFKPKNGFNGHKFFPSEVKMNPNTLPTDWTWAYDPTAPTNRQNYKSFVKGENPTTILDYFVVSPNIELLMAKTIDLNFENSDHNPVYVKVKLILN